MNPDGGFGQRQSPSIANVMLNSSPMYIQSEWSPIFPSVGFGRSNVSSSQQTFSSYTRFTPSSREDFSNSQPMTREFEIISNIEKKIYSQIDASLKKHYKRMKSKLKSVQKRVIENERSLVQLQDIIDSSIAETIKYDIQFSQHVDCKKKKKFTWRREKSDFSSFEYNESKKESPDLFQESSFF